MTPSERVAAPVTPYDSELTLLKQRRAQNDDTDEGKRYYDKKIAAAQSRRDVWLNGYATAQATIERLRVALEAEVDLPFIMSCIPLDWRGDDETKVPATIGQIRGFAHLIAAMQRTRQLENAKKALQAEATGEGGEAWAGISAGRALRLR